jgi:hypothetical protein
MHALYMHALDESSRKLVWSVSSRLAPLGAALVKDGGTLSSSQTPDALQGATSWRLRAEEG